MTGTGYTLSFIISTKNRLPFLKILFAHLLPVIKPDEEIVVVDSESTDGSAEYLQGLFASNKIHQFISEPDKNQAHGWNKALLMAKGTIIKKLIDDDVHDIEAIRKCRDFMLQHSEADICISDTLEGNLANPSYTGSSSRLAYYRQWKNGVAKTFTFSDVTMLQRGSSLSFLGLYDTQFKMIDWEYSLRVTYLKAKIAYYTGYNSMSVPTPGNVSSSATKDLFKLEEHIGKVKYSYLGDESDISIYSKIKVWVGETLDSLKNKITHPEPLKMPTEDELMKIYSAYYQKLEKQNKKGSGNLFFDLKTTVKIKFQNGIDGETARKEILNELQDEFIFEESDQPDFIIFGPYGIDIPPPGNYTRIGYFCENIYPDLSICDWAFGVIPEDKVNNPAYKRIQWHGLDPQKLVKPANYDAKAILSQKKHFCNFLYSHPVAYREEFFRQLSKYKKIDAPGHSMNNAENIDKIYSGDIWERKRQYLSEYKFTIAFENYVYPGYQTEKLYDAMQAGSIPIYCGDPYIGQIFNTASFVNTPDYVKTSGSAVVNWLEETSQRNFKDILPAFYNTPPHRIRRKLKSIGRDLKMQYQFKKLDFTPLIDRIIELDRDDDKYLSVLEQPWFVNNIPPANASLKHHWIKIFSTAK